MTLTTTQRRHCLTVAHTARALLAALSLFGCEPTLTSDLFPYEGPPVEVNDYNSFWLDQRADHLQGVAVDQKGEPALALALASNVLSLGQGLSYSLRIGGRSPVAVERGFNKFIPAKGIGGRPVRSLAHLPGARPASKAVSCRESHGHLGGLER